MRHMTAVVLAFCATAATAARAEPPQNDLEARIVALETEIERATDANEALASELEDATARIADLRERNAALRKALAERDAEVRRLRSVADERAAAAAEAEAAVDRARADAEAARRKTEAAAAERRDRFVRRDKDQATGRTVLRTRPTQLDVTHGSRAEHYVVIALPAEGPAALRVMAYGSGRSYDHLEGLRFRVGDEAIELAITSYDRERRVTGSRKNRVDRSNEILEARLPREALERLAEAEAEAISGRLGPTRFEAPRALGRACAALLEASAGAAEDRR